MKNLVLPLGCVAVLLAACDIPNTSLQGTTNGATSVSYLSEVPEGVVALAAPNQDLTTVQIDPADGCYVYRHVGPVETTMLPLRATNGRPICSQHYVADADAVTEAT